ncbi:putative disease resistance protein RGA3 [Phalaenopsis equestris]|uniref:putative disease resistance protein RGA3 n=1 Tax=Phalaenopsis equestris TaxID=78828 RepID=UPI0009E28065|nr:putative disease resistance protein RGA3 [Phalaenopsis equestris]
MAMILDAFVGNCVEKLTSMASEKVVMVLGVRDELKRLQRRMARIHKFLEAAERRRLEDPDINHWVGELKDVAYDADDIIDLCRIQGTLLLIDRPSSSKRRTVCFDFSLLSSCFASVPHRYEIAESIKALNDKLEEIYKDRLQFNLEESREKPKLQTITAVNTRQTSPLVEFDVLGIEIEVATKELVTIIVAEQANKCRVFALTGMGGIGKTTLAQKIYNDKKIQTEFQIKVWVCVSQSYNEIELLQQLIRGAGGYYGEARTKTELQPILQSVAHGKSLFLVLDDVWRADVWINLFKNPLQSAAAFVRILVTTRDENVAREMGVAHIHPVMQLSVQTSWEILWRRVFVEGEEREIGMLIDLGVQIVIKCSGLPLAIKAIAGVLAKKEKSRREWEKVLRNDAWSMRNLPEELRGALYLSYDDLPSNLKQCFVYCSLFPEDESLDRDDLVRLWVAEGFVKEQADSLVEDVAEEYYNELIRRNLLQPDPFDATECRMHDLLRSLAKFLSQDETFSGKTMAATTPSSSTKLRRLSIETPESVSAIKDLQKCLRTLLTFNGIKVLNDNQLMGLARLRVLRINNVDIDSIPNSIGDLIHLRYLNLDETNIKELPESIGSLTNLQFLNLRACTFLMTLPKSITKLHNLRRLGLYNTPLISIPKGISKLEKINDLSGFVVADSREPEDSYSSLEELLNSLYQLRMLSISRMERVRRGALSLQKLTRLIDLKLLYTKAADRPLTTEEDITRIEDVLEQLCPPQCLERLHIRKFFGALYPSWMKSPSFGHRLPHLTTLELSKNISCSQLPPAGELPQLTHLYIIGAAAVKSIGSEFLGVGVWDGNYTASRIIFPNLQKLILRNMPELEEWSFNKEMEEFEHGRGKTYVLPHLENLVIDDCPKLKALPKGLEQSKMKTLYIQGAHSLQAVENLITVEQLMIVDNQSLEMVSHLPALQVLQVNHCPALNSVKKLESLERLNLFDVFMERIPEWVARLLKEQNLADDADFLFQLVCNERTLSRLLKGGPDWSIIERIPRVFASDNVGRGFLRYSRNPFNYYTNLFVVD